MSPRFLRSARLPSAFRATESAKCAMRFKRGKLKQPQVLNPGEATMTRSTSTSTLLSALLLSLVSATVACSDAQTPDAYFAADVIPGDGGQVGQRNFPCRTDNSCLDEADTCIRGGDGTNACRQTCDPAGENEGGCPTDFECRNIIDTNGGACVPVGPLGGVDDACPCADGLRCVRFDGVDGGAADLRCRTECEVVDGGATACPDGEGQCRLFDDSDTVGACVQ